jgi:putative flippase GtrA
MTLSVTLRAALAERRSLQPLARLFVDLLRYGAASAAALTVDAGTLLLLVSFFGVNYLVAASIGFLSGLATVYALSVRYVYDDSRVLRPVQEAAGFLVTGLIGLILTQASMALLVGAFGLQVGVAKIPTVAVVFLFNFLSRRMLLFSSGANNA